MQVIGGREPGFAVVDLETTGFSPAHDRIVEVAVVLLTADGDTLGEFCTLVDPGCDPGPSHVHGISAEMLVGAPTFRSIHPYLVELLSHRVLVGHNVDLFDLAFLEAECRTSGGARSVPHAVVTVDTLSVVQELLGRRGNARLAECCDHFGIAWEEHHHALGDARVTARLLRALREALGDDALGIAERLRAAIGCAWPGVVGGESLTAGRRRSLPA